MSNEKTPNYIPSAEEFKKAKDIADDIKWEQIKEIEALCEKIEEPLERITEILRGRKHAEDALVEQSRGYALRGCRDIRDGLKLIREGR